MSLRGNRKAKGKKGCVHKSRRDWSLGTEMSELALLSSELAMSMKCTRKSL